jgi:hypothetical protein
MSLESIPLEILLEIAHPESGIRLSALASLSAVNRLFHAVLTPCLYKRGAEISNKAMWGYRHPAAWAIRNNQVRTLKRLIEYGLSTVSSRTRIHLGDIHKLYSGFSPLYYAFDTEIYKWEKRIKRTNDNRRDNIEIVDLLLKNGAWRDFVDDHYAAEILHKAVGERGYNLEAQLRLLLDYRANVNAMDQHGVTALHLATSLKRTATVRILLRYGADMTLEDDGVADGIPISPLIIALHQDSDVILRVFKEHELWLESLSC